MMATTLSKIMGISSYPSFPRQFWVEYFSAVAALSCLAPPRFGSQSNSGLMMLPQNYVLTRRAKNQYTWKGFAAIPAALKELQEEGAKDTFHRFYTNENPKVSDDDEKEFSQPHCSSQTVSSKLAWISSPIFRYDSSKIGSDGTERAHRLEPSCSKHFSFND